jgi:hypothetical protein
MSNMRGINPHIIANESLADLDSVTSPLVLSGGVLTHANVGTAGTYRTITTDARGHVSSATIVSAPAAIVALTDAATIACDATLGNRFSVTPTVNRIFGNPTGAVDGQRIAYMVTIGGAGTLTLTFGNKFAAGSALTLAALTTAAALLAAAAKFRFEVEYDATLDKFILLNYQTTIA